MIEAKLGMESVPHGLIKVISKLKGILANLRRKAGTGDSKYLNIRQLSVFDHGVYTAKSYSSGAVKRTSLVMIFIFYKPITLIQ